MASSQADFTKYHKYLKKKEKKKEKKIIILNPYPSGNAYTRRDNGSYDIIIRNAI